MKRPFVFRLKLFAILLGIPVVALAISFWLQSTQNTSYRKSLRQHYYGNNEVVSSDVAERIARASVRQSCAIPAFREANPEPCRLSDTFRWVSIFSVVSATLALALYLGIAFAGKTKFRDREHLLRIFVPVFKITGYSTAFLALVYAVLLTGIAFFAETEFLGFFHWYILLIPFGGMVAAAACWNSVRAALKPGFVPHYFAKAASPENESELWSFIASVASKVGAQPPKHVLLGIDANFFVMDGDLRTLDGPMSGRILYLSLPLCRLLKRDELEAVIAHEMAHFAGQDTEYGKKYLPIYRGVGTAFSEINRGGFAAIPVRLLMNHFLYSFGTAVATIDRERELAADDAGARTASPRSIALALVKLHLYSSLLDSMRQALRDAVFERKPIPDPVALFGQRVADVAAARPSEGIEQRRLPHPTDSHPQLQVRMKSLKLEMGDVLGEAFEVPPAPAAMTLISRGDAVEREIWGVIRDAAVSDFASLNPAVSAM